MFVADHPDWKQGIPRNTLLMASNGTLWKIAELKETDDIGDFKEFDWREHPELFFPKEMIKPNFERSKKIMFVADHPTQKPDENNVPKIEVKEPFPPGTSKCPFDDSVAAMLDGVEAAKQFAAKKKENDKVNNPSHYTYGKWEVIDILRGMLTPEQLEGFLLGNVLKYTFRYSHKNGSEDLRKAGVYLGWLTELVASWEQGDYFCFSGYDDHCQAVTEKTNDKSTMTGDPVHGYTFHREDAKK